MRSIIQLYLVRGLRLVRLFNSILDTSLPPHCPPPFNHLPTVLLRSISGSGRQLPIVLLHSTPTPSVRGLGLVRLFNSILDTSLPHHCPPPFNHLPTVLLRSISGSGRQLPIVLLHSTPAPAPLSSSVQPAEAAVNFSRT